MKQTTIGQKVAFAGPAIHSATVNQVTLLPAPDDTGICFRRIDLKHSPAIKATVEHVVSTERCTTIGVDGVHVSTIEHLMAAFRGFGIDNCIIEIDGPEVPIVDGSAAEFCTLIERAGIVRQETPRRVAEVRKPIWVAEDDKIIVALPYDGLRVSFTFTNDHNHPELSDLHAQFDVKPEYFISEIAPARTIGWLSEVESLQAEGLALGANMDMAIVLGETEVLTPLRFHDEPVRHKILDLIGDLFLAGWVHAHIIAIRTGHSLNVKLGEKLSNHFAAWQD